MKKRSLRAVAFFLLLFAGWLSVGTLGFAEESAVDYYLDSNDIPSQTGDPQSGITIKTAVPDADSANPGNAGDGDGTGNPSANPGDASGGGSASPGGADPQSGTRTPGADMPGDPSTGGTGAGDAQDPSAVNAGDANSSGDPNAPNPDSPGGANSGGTGSGDTRSGDADPNDANPNEADPNGADPEEADVPWYKKLWNKAKDALKGGVAGAIGAGIVIGVVLVGAAILGVTVGAPLLIGAAVAGIVAGAIYGIVAGDSFSWMKGIGIGGLAALSVISLGQLGIGAAIRGGLSLLRSVGFRGALRSAGSRALGFLRGAIGGMKNGLAALARSPLKTIGSALKSKAFGISFGVGFLSNVFGHLASEGRLPTVKETLVMAGISFAGALLLDGIFRGVRMVRAARGNKAPVAPKPQSKPKPQPKQEPPKPEPPKNNQPKPNPNPPPEVRYSGNLVKVPKPDPAADKLADRLGGRSCLKFDSDPAGREFDVISNEYVAQTKPPLQSFGKNFRTQVKATFEAAKATGRKPYFHFDGEPAQEVIDKINQYSERYGIEVIIDTLPL
jgi:hypothetical protein